VLHQLVEAETVRIIALEAYPNTVVLVDDEPAPGKARSWRWREVLTFTGKGLILGRKLPRGAFCSTDLSVVEVRDAVVFCGAAISDCSCSA